MKTKESKIAYHPPITKFWEDEGYFIIPGVFHKGEIGTYRLFEQMTPKMTQDKLSEFYEQEKPKGNPYPTGAPLIWAIAKKAYELEDPNSKTSKKLRKFIQTGFQRYPNTLTSVIYSPSGKDRIVHNHRTSDEYFIDAHVVGPNDWINEIPDKNILEKLLGTSNIKQINDVSQWINKTNIRIWRLNSKPKTKDERVAGFGAYDWLDLNCYRDPLRECPAFRVLRVD